MSCSGACCVNISIDAPVSSRCNAVTEALLELHPPDSLWTKGLSKRLPCRLPHGVAGVADAEHGVVKCLGRQLWNTWKPSGGQASS